MTTYSYDLANTSYAQQIIHRSKASGVSLFLFNNRLQNEQAITFIHQWNTPYKAIELYRNGLFRFDSNLPHEALPQRLGARYVTSKNKRLNGNGTIITKGNKKYWETLSNFGYDQTAAMVQSISTDIYMVIGLHLVNPKYNLDVDKSLSLLESWISESCDYIIGESVSNFQCALSHNASASTFQTTAETLTKREFQVVCEVLKGKSNKQIAATLKMSEHTVDNHLRRVYRKFGVHSRTALAAAVNNQSQH
ncbi:MAG: LuxR C-terminal-related transcriptional regulator [Porticoccaceae bacterium]|nr:LuxR C-terminal-related transcriptional regulator [Porticoccaceae bacterium]